MARLKINNKKYCLLFGRNAISNKIKQIASKIKNDYEGKDTPIVILVLTGGLYFGIDLSKELGEIGFNHHLDTVGLKRYSADEKGGAVEILSKPHSKISRRNLIIVEDIIDNGETMNFLNDYLKNSDHPPRSISYCSLLVRKKHGPLKFKINYLGFEIESGWVVGYGMDSGQLYRWLKDIYIEY